MPVTDINPATSRSTGWRSPKRRSRKTPTTVIGERNSHAIITISPRSALNSNGDDTITITGRCYRPRRCSPNLDRHGHGHRDGGSVTPVISGLAGVPTGPDMPIDFVPPYGANQYTPR